MRWTGISTGCIYPISSVKSSQWSSGWIQSHLPVHRTQPVGGGAHFRSGSSYVFGENCWIGTQKRALQLSTPPLYTSIDLSHPSAGSQSRARTHIAWRWGTKPIESTRWLQLPPPLPDSYSPLLARRTYFQRDQHRPLGGMFPCRRKQLEWNLRVTEFNSKQIINSVFWIG